MSNSRKLSKEQQAQIGDLFDIIWKPKDIHESSKNIINNFIEQLRQITKITEPTSIESKTTAASTTESYILNKEEIVSFAIMHIALYHSTDQHPISRDEIKELAADLMKVKNHVRKAIAELRKNDKLWAEIAGIFNGILQPHPVNLNNSSSGEHGRMDSTFERLVRNIMGEKPAEKKARTSTAEEKSKMLSHTDRVFEKIKEEKALLMVKKNEEDKEGEFVHGTFVKKIRESRGCLDLPDDVRTNGQLLSAFKLFAKAQQTIIKTEDYSTEEQLEEHLVSSFVTNLRATIEKSREKEPLFAFIKGLQTSSKQFVDDKAKNKYTNTPIVIRIRASEDCLELPNNELINGQLFSAYNLFVQELEKTIKKEDFPSETKLNEYRVSSFVPRLKAPIKAGHEIEPLSLTIQRLQTASTQYLAHRAESGYSPPDNEGTVQNATSKLTRKGASSSSVPSASGRQSSTIKPLGSSNDRGGSTDEKEKVRTEKEREQRQRERETEQEIAREREREREKEKEKEVERERVRLENENRGKAEAEAKAAAAAAAVTIQNTINTARTALETKPRDTQGVANLMAQLKNIRTEHAKATAKPNVTALQNDLKVYIEAITKYADESKELQEFRNDIKKDLVNNEAKKADEYLPKFKAEYGKRIEQIKEQKAIVDKINQELLPVAGEEDIYVEAKKQATATAIALGNEITRLQNAYDKEYNGFADASKEISAFSEKVSAGFPETKEEKERFLTGISFDTFLEAVAECEKTKSSKYPIVATAVENILKTYIQPYVKQCKNDTDNRINREQGVITSITRTIDACLLDIAKKEFTTANTNLTNLKKYSQNCEREINFITIILGLEKIGLLDAEIKTTLEKRKAHFEKMRKECNQFISTLETAMNSATNEEKNKNRAGSSSSTSSSSTSTSSPSARPTGSPTSTSPPSASPSSSSTTSSGGGDEDKEDKGKDKDKQREKKAAIQKALETIRKLYAEVCALTKNCDLTETTIKPLQVKCGELNPAYTTFNTLVNETPDSEAQYEASNIGAAIKRLLDTVQATTTTYNNSIKLQTALQSLIANLLAEEKATSNINKQEDIDAIRTNLVAYTRALQPIVEEEAKLANPISPNAENLDRPRVEIDKSLRATTESIEVAKKKLQAIHKILSEKDYSLEIKTLKERMNALIIKLTTSRNIAPSAAEIALEQSSFQKIVRNDYLIVTSNPLNSELTFTDPLNDLETTKRALETAYYAIYPKPYPTPQSISEAVNSLKQRMDELKRDITQNMTGLYEEKSPYILINTLRRATIKQDLDDLKAEAKLFVENIGGILTEDQKKFLERAGKEVPLYAPLSSQLSAIYDNLNPVAFGKMIDEFCNDDDHFDHAVKISKHIELIDPLVAILQPNQAKDFAPAQLARLSDGVRDVTDSLSSRFEKLSSDIKKKYDGILAKIPSDKLELVPSITKKEQEEFVALANKYLNNFPADFVDDKNKTKIPDRRDEIKKYLAEVNANLALLNKMRTAFTTLDDIRNIDYQKLLDNYKKVNKALNDMSANDEKDFPAYKIAYAELTNELNLIKGKIASISVESGPAELNNAISALTTKKETVKQAFDKADEAISALEFRAKLKELMFKIKSLTTEVTTNSSTTDETLLKSLRTKWKAIDSEHKGLPNDVTKYKESAIADKATIDADIEVLRAAYNKLTPIRVNAQDLASYFERIRKELNFSKIDQFQSENTYLVGKLKEVKDRYDPPGTGNVEADADELSRLTRELLARASNFTKILRVLENNDRGGSGTPVPPGTDGDFDIRLKKQKADLAEALDSNHKGAAAEILIIEQNIKRLEELIALQETCDALSKQRMIFAFSKEEDASEVVDLTDCIDDSAREAKINKWIEDRNNDIASKPKPPLASLSKVPDQNLTTVIGQGKCRINPITLKSGTAYFVEKDSDVMSAKTTAPTAISGPTSKLYSIPDDLNPAKIFLKAFIERTDTLKALANETPKSDPEYAKKEKERNDNRDYYEVIFQRMLTRLRHSGKDVNVLNIRKEILFERHMMNEGERPLFDNESNLARALVNAYDSKMFNSDHGKMRRFSDFRPTETIRSKFDFIVQAKRFVLGALDSKADRMVAHYENAPTTSDSRSLMPNNDLIELAIRQVESFFESLGGLDKTPDPNTKKINKNAWPTIVISNVFDRRYAEAMINYCHAKEYNFINYTEYSIKPVKKKWEKVINTIEGQIERDKSLRVAADRHLHGAPIAPKSVSQIEAEEAARPKPPSPP